MDIIEAQFNCDKKRSFENVPWKGYSKDRVPRGAKLCFTLNYFNLIIRRTDFRLLSLYTQKKKRTEKM